MAPIIYKIEKASEIVERDYLDYERYSNNTRTVPGLDGLILVQRRILLAIKDTASGSGWTKSAKVVGCFIGDTKVKCLDGTIKTLKDIPKGNKFWVYTSDRQVSFKLATSLGITNYVTELVEIELDSGEKELCTPNHLWMLRDGTYNEAQYLLDCSLMSLYTDNHKVVKVTKIFYKDPIPVYDISVPDTQNFALASGVFVHNSTTEKHPHGDSYGSLVGLVKNKLVEGHGQFGADFLKPIPPAAMRYTSVRAHKKFTEAVFRLVPYVPHIIDVDEPEPVFLPVCIPLCFTTSQIGIGTGLLSKIPIFDPRSIANALFKDDPSLLKGPQGVIILAGDLDRLWTKGIGWIQYSLNCYQEYNNDDARLVSIIEGPGRVFIPRVEEGLKLWLDDESIYLRDESSDQIRAVIGKVKNIRKVTEDEIHAKCLTLSRKSIYYQLYTSYDGTVYRIPMREWLQTTWNIFQIIVEKWKLSNTKKIEHKIIVYKAVRKIADQLARNKTIEEISSITGDPIDIIKEVEGMPMRLLRKTDFHDKVQQLQSELVIIQKTTDKDLLEGFLESLY